MDKQDFTSVVTHFSKLKDRYELLDGSARSFDAISISMASPDQIRSWSYGEVTKPDTLNYRTIRPENDGLFCAKIFGPAQDYECLCGKYKKIKYRGVVCEKCGVEVTTSKVRRERMGHIELASPVVHIWFLRSLPSRISILLDIPLKDMERILYFEAYIITDPMLSPFMSGQIISEDEYNNAIEQFGEGAFEVGTGAEVVKKMLQELDLKRISIELRAELESTTSESKKKKIVKRLKLIEQFIESGNDPANFVLEVLPVMPPDLRPLVMLDAGRFATSDLNELYRRVVNRNNRLRKLLDLGAPDIIIKNEKRMLQEAVDALFDNGRKGRILKNANKRPFKSIADMLKGKQGRFRQNLLGKRVDYSGRSVIVVGPELKLHQCGLPKEMALELFKPFVYSKLEMYGITATLRAAKKMVEMRRPEVWDLLDEVIREHPVLLNRAPTLHRIGIQAFEPILIEGKAIQLHPLVCSAFNADFDGDQMAVHVPLSIEAQLEARVLMMSTNNILSPANGSPVIVPSKDIVLGLYCLTLEFAKQKGEGMVFSDIAEIEHALYSGAVALHAKIKCRSRFIDVEGNESYALADTTPGRVILYDIVPKASKIGFDAVNKLMTKKSVSDLMDLVYRKCGQKDTVIFADKIMKMGFDYSTWIAPSVGKDDMIIPESKKEHVARCIEEVKQYEKQYSNGLITGGEKYNKAIDAWSRCTDRVAVDMISSIRGEGRDSSIEKMNSLYMMADSGARGSVSQIKQVAGMRGLMTKPSGEIIETPIVSNFKEGLGELEFFISTHGARKGLADTALKTANSGYLTRKLVDVAQDCIVTNFDCGTKNGLIIQPVVEGGEIIVTISQLALGRIAVNEIKNPITGKVIVSESEMIDEEKVELIEEAGIDSIKVRSVITCENDHGCCVKCYGRDLATGEIVNLGEAVGVVAAQSIGEPGTQLTMRTFHIGGAAQRTAAQSSIVSSYKGKIKFVHANTIIDSHGGVIVMSRNCEVLILDMNNVEKARYKIPHTSKLLVQDGHEIAVGDKIAEWDPFSINIVSEKQGKVRFVDIIPGVSVSEVYDDSTGIVNLVVSDGKKSSKAKDLRPRIVLVNDDGEVLKLSNGLDANYYMQVGAILTVFEGDEVVPGTIMARIPKESSKSRDITGGLPRVIELFEARQPKEHSVIAEIDGCVEFGKDYKSRRRLVVRSTENPEYCVEYFIPRGRRILVVEGDMVSKGDTLMEGSPSPHDILRVMGVQAFASYMINEVQQVYRLQGVFISDKHIEIILRQMLRKVEIRDAGSTTFIAGEHVNKLEVEKENRNMAAKGLNLASVSPVLQGITKASLQTESFFSAASFQETTRVIIEAVIAGKKDYLIGLKENVIVGRLIPAGTGFYMKKIRESTYS